MGYSDNWVCKIIITNHTQYKLSVMTSRLAWGYWYRDNVDNRAPTEVAPGESCIALAVRAAAGSATGYECSCTWRFSPATGSSAPNGTFSLSIDVPYSKDNKSSISTSGFLRAASWSALPKRGHEFTRAIDIYEIGDDSHPSQNADAMEQEDQEDLDYYDSLASNAECIEDWSMLEKVAAVETFKPKNAIPAQYTLPPRAIMIGRSKPVVIDKKYWNGFQDPKFPELFHKLNRVKEYFAVGVYYVNTDARCTESIPSGMSIATKKTVEVQSSISSTLEENMSIKASIEGQYGSSEGQHVKATLETAFSVTSIVSESSSKLERTETTVEIGSESFDRLYVQWLFTIAVALYRRKLDGSVQLVAVSEWPLEVIERTYKDV